MDDKVEREEIKRTIDGIADDIIESFDKMMKAKAEALKQATDALPNLLKEAGLPEMHFEISPGLYYFMLTGFADSFDEEDASARFRSKGLFPCLTASADSDADVLQYDLVVTAGDGKDSDTETFLTKIGRKGDVLLFNGEEWVDLSETIDDEDEDCGTSDADDYDDADELTEDDD